MEVQMVLELVFLEFKSQSNIMDYVIRAHWNPIMTQLSMNYN
jgi:hypothetical protein